MKKVELNIYDIIDDLFKNKKELWEYHEYVHWEDIFESENCHLFIESYLGQAATLPEPDSLAGVLAENHFVQIASNRYQHIVFTFFLGLKIYEKCDSIRTAIDNKFCNSEEFKVGLEKHQKAPFAYIWFLICLFHDLGYQFESNEIQDNAKFDSFENLKEHVTLETYENYSVYLDSLSGVPDYFTFELIDNYYRYRKDYMHSVDHGIVGGMYLFRDLCSIRRMHYKNEPNKVEKGWWKPELEKIFRLASSIVLCHNIFLPDRNSYTKYEKFGLDRLRELAENIVDDEYPSYPIKMEDYPIFFLFGLVDSIEPIKVVKDVEHLKHVFWDIQKDSITISTDLTCVFKDRLLGNVRTLKNWLCQAVDINEFSVKLTISNL